MLSNKDIRVEGGNIIINGEKYAIVQDVSDLEEEVNTLSETVGDETDGLVKDVSDIDGRVTVLEGKVVKYTDVTLQRSSSGYAAPVTSAGGAVYERLGNYTALGVARDKILSVNMINWGAITKSFSFYLGESGLTALSDNTTSIYNENDPGAYVVVRVVYTD